MIGVYLPIALTLIASLSIAFAFLFLAAFLGPKYPNKSKEYPFECGWLIDSKDTRKKHSVKFYMIAIMFLIFDLEIVFLYPFAAVFRKIGISALVEMFVFIGILVIGYIYVWKKGVLEWE